MNFLDVSGIDLREVFEEHFVTSVSDVACRAAIELDNARLERNDTFPMCHLLVQWLRGLAEDQQACHAFGFMEIMWPLLKPDEQGKRLVPYPHDIQTVDELIIAIDHLASQLDRVARHPERYRAKDCERLNEARDTCLEISKMASLAEWEDRYPRRLCA